MKTLAIALAVASIAAHAECNGTYNGVIEGKLSGPPHTYTFIDASIVGTLTAFNNNGESVFVTINGTDYRFQEPMVNEIEFDNVNCKFYGAYDADKIFRWFD